MSPSHHKSLDKTIDNSYSYILFYVYVLVMHLAIAIGHASLMLVFANERSMNILCWHASFDHSAKLRT